MINLKFQLLELFLFMIFCDKCGKLFIFLSLRNSKLAAEINSNVPKFFLCLVSALVRSFLNPNSLEEVVTIQPLL